MHLMRRPTWFSRQIDIGVWNPRRFNVEATSTSYYTRLALEYVARAEIDRMETLTSTKITSIWRRKNVEKSTWRTHRCFIDFESEIHVDFSTSNRCHNFHVDSLFKIDEISMNFLRGISTSNRWRINEDLSIE